MNIKTIMTIPFPYTFETGSALCTGLSGNHCPTNKQTKKIQKKYFKKKILLDYII